MNIAHVVCVFPPYKGGIGKSALDFSLMISSLDNYSVVFTPLYDNKKEKLVDSIEVVRVKPLIKIGNGAFIPTLFFKLKKFDLVYLHYPFFGGSEIVWLFKLLNKKTKLIIHYHMDVTGLPWFLKILSLPTKIIQKSLFNKADLITVASFDYLENSDIANYYIKNKEKFRETYFPVDTCKFFPKKNMIEPGVKKILFVGGLDRAHYFKGLEVLIDAMASLGDRNDWELIVVGRGGLQNFYHNKCKENNIFNRVTFLNSVSDEDLPLVYRDSDFLVLPSINKGEAFGIVLLEAMASGLPLIASNLPGVRSVYSDEEGLRVAPNDAGDLSEKIKFFLENPDIVSKMGKNARNLVKSKYAKEKISERLNTIINNI